MYLWYLAQPRDQGYLRTYLSTLRYQKGLKGRACMYENRHTNKAQDQLDLAWLASADTIFNSKVDRDDVTQLN